MTCFHLSSVWSLKEPCRQAPTRGFMDGRMASNHSSRLKRISLLCGLLRDAQNFSARRCIGVITASGSLSIPSLCSSLPHGCGLDLRMRLSWLSSPLAWFLGYDALLSSLFLCLALLGCCLTSTMFILKQFA